MPPFLQFRLWLHDATRTELVFGGVVALLVLALVALAIVPVVSRDDRTAITAGASGATNVAEAHGAPSDATASGGGSSPAAGASASPTAGSGVSGSRSSGPRAVVGTDSTPTGAAGASAPALCAGRTASGPGVTPSEVRVVTTNLSLAGPIGNSTFDVRPDLQAIAKALADDINDHGGVACGRKIALKQYDVNPLDPTDGQSKCLQIQQDNPFVVIDFGGYLTPVARACFVQAKIPMTTATAFARSELKSGYPYLFGPRNLAEEQAHNGILGLHQRGFFAAPKFKKLGLFEDGCVPGVNQQIAADLAKVGVKPAQVSTFTLDCNISAPPNQIAQAVLQHKADGVTHVFLATSTTNDQNYLRVAAAQSFRPVYGGSDYGEVLTASGTQNWDASFDGALGITSEHTGEQSSQIRSAEVEACDQIMKRHGVPGFVSEKKDSAVLGYCDLFWLFKRAIDKAGVSPTRTTLVEGLAAIGLFKSAGLGDGNFNRPRKVTGGDFQRAIQYHADCQCWKILDRGFKPAY